LDEDAMKLLDYYRDKNLIWFDAGATILSVVISFLLRLELSQFVLDYLPTVLWMIGIGLVFKLLAYYFFGLYKRVWIYASVKEMRLIVLAVMAGSLAVSVVMLALFYLNVFSFFPRSVLVIDALVSLVLISGTHLGVRFVNDYFNEENNGSSEKEHNVLVIGAGSAGVLVVREMLRNTHLDMVPKAFLDDDPQKQNMVVNGVPVVGGLDDLVKVLKGGEYKEVIIAIPTASGSVIRKVSEVCSKKKIPFRTMPGIYELLGGRVSVNRLRDVDISDLLRREPTSTDDVDLTDCLTGKKVLVTGAGGSIASELCRQICRWEPKELVLVGHGENSIFDIMVELEDNYPALSIYPIIADTRDRERILSVFKKYDPDIVFHAAAHKHVYLMEMNPVEAITNNILGTKNVVDAAVAVDVDDLVMISTDKAVQPTSVMGASKRIAEMVVLDSAERFGRQFSVVRFGNVLGSRGSVVPLFKHQIANGGPVTVRHPEIDRYFMTIPEAVHLVLQASNLADSGKLYLLNMGEPVKILQLAEDLIRLSGLEPYEDIDIVFTEIVQGEKLSESLYYDEEHLEKTSHAEINQVNDANGFMGEALQHLVNELSGLAKNEDVDGIIALLNESIQNADLTIQHSL
jgi:FlaA1/EpsC-like NDP-sugar epimerase